jgi:hypothetical protein
VDPVRFLRLVQVQVLQVYRQAFPHQVQHRDHHLDQLKDRQPIHRAFRALVPRLVLQVDPLRVHLPVLVPDPR